MAKLLLFSICLLCVFGLTLSQGGFNTFSNVNNGGDPDAELTQRLFGLFDNDDGNSTGNSPLCIFALASLGQNGQLGGGQNLLQLLYYWNSLTKGNLFEGDVMEVLLPFLFGGQGGLGGQNIFQLLPYLTGANGGGSSNLLSLFSLLGPQGRFGGAQNPFQLFQTLQLFCGADNQLSLLQILPLLGGGGFGGSQPFQPYNPFSPQGVGSNPIVNNNNNNNVIPGLFGK
ncbi:unnamed protein product [Clavelina lepadiformis]|uniref:Uncharacterized protein n=1 Tax=Clavelina lepadiformis TaxID=159417 RepID=A0ABP0GLQ3_CLALP